MIGHTLDKNIIRSILTNLFLLASISAHAQYMAAEGVFSSDSLGLQVILLDEEKGIVAAATSIVIGSCSGSISGVGKISGRSLTFAPYKKLEQGETCSITAEFDKTWNRVRVTEGKGCSPYHGASCGWEGQVAAKRQ